VNFNRTAAIVAAVAFVIAVGIGLYMAGSPAEQRLARFDQQRVADLHRIRNSVGAYWRAQGVLPARVDEDVIGFTLGVVPRDPETDAEYEYQVAGDDAYRLCAVFSRVSPESMAGEFWAHDAGRQCFEFQVTENQAN
jgi:hypothetical protein